MKTKYITAGTGKYAPKLYALSLNKVSRRFWRVEIAPCDVNGKMVKWLKFLKLKLLPLG